jgi:lactoylglutathione lyase
MTEFRFDHIHLRSPDPAATAEFYRKMFGAEVTSSVGPPGTAYAGLMRYSMKLGGQTVLVAPTDPRSPNAAPPKPPYHGLEHMGLAVDDIDASTADLKAKGAEFTVEPTTIGPGLRIAFLRGPQGVLVELVQRG